MNGRRQFLRLFGASALILLASCPRKFDPDKWREADLLTRERARMMDELQGQHVLKGLTRQEVIELLGEPTPTEYFSDWDMVYVLGPTPIFPIDFEWLIIRLDESGRVAEYHQVYD